MDQMLIIAIASCVVVIILIFIILKLLKGKKRNKYKKILDKIIHKHYTENSNGKYAIIKVQYIFCIWIFIYKSAEWEIKKRRLHYE